MTAAMVSVEIPASASEVWKLIGGFGSLPDWLPYIPNSELSQGGRVRRLENPNGEVIVENLVAFNENERYYMYSIIEAPFPIKDYTSTLRVRDTSDTKKSIVEWSGTFTPVGVTDEEAKNLFTTIYMDGLNALKQAVIHL